MLLRTKSISGCQPQLEATFVPVTRLDICETANNLHRHRICRRKLAFRQKVSPCWNRNSDVIKPGAGPIQRCACKLFNNWLFATGWEETLLISAAASFQGVNTSILEFKLACHLNLFTKNLGSLWVNSSTALKEPRMRHEATREVFWEWG